MINVGTNITQNRPIFRDRLINKAFIKNQSDGNVNDNTNFTIAINIFPIVVNTKKNIIRSSFFNFLYLISRKLVPI